MKRRAHIHTYGDVNGVSFRFLVKQKAQSLGLKGICKQNEEKEIIIDIEGNTKSLEEFLNYILKGVSPVTKKNSFEIEFFEDIIGYTTLKTDIV
ncbi:acylphosphatase [Psychrobacillus glaciei]|uniref:Acylphosphatase n=1 Tax=Psychrobacillus glaciei TaxID=2283160 RepID=A0A5J6SQ63_9BACI|nr:acylphosphatase [Psychrobacillus glaciei]QFF98934.1 acylphosphatase [Psychrobacillus glaciei]